MWKRRRRRGGGGLCPRRGRGGGRGGRVAAPPLERRLPDYVAGGRAGLRRKRHIDGHFVEVALRAADLECGDAGHEGGVGAGWGGRAEKMGGETQKWRKVEGEELGCGKWGGTSGEECAGFGELQKKKKWGGRGGSEASVREGRV